MICEVLSSIWQSHWLKFVVLIFFIGAIAFLIQSTPSIREGFEKFLESKFVNGFHLAIDSYFDWGRIKELMESPVLKGAWIWLILVPLLISFDGKDISLKIFFDFQKDVVFPSSLIALYGSGILLFVARMLYSAICPRFIRKYRNVHDVIEDGWTIQSIRNEASAYLVKLYSDNIWVGSSPPPEGTPTRKRLEALLKQYRLLDPNEGAFIRLSREQLRNHGLNIEGVDFRRGKDGHYHLGGGRPIIISHDQLLSHLFNDLAALQNYAWPVIRFFIGLLLMAALALAAYPVVLGMCEVAQFISGTYPNV